MSQLIPVDVLWSLFGCLEGGVIILDSQGKVVHLNDWVLQYSVQKTQDYAGKALEEVLDGAISEQLISAIDSAVNNSLSRILSHKIHRKILPFYRDKNHSDAQELNVSVLISPLKDMAGILIRIVDYTALVNREKQNRINEALLTIERNYFKRASDISLSLDRFVTDLIADMSSNVSFLSLRFSLLINRRLLRFPDSNVTDSQKTAEKIVQHQAFVGESLCSDINALNVMGERSIGVLEFSFDHVKGVVELVKQSDHILDVSFEKTADKIKGLLLSLIEWKISYEKLNYMATHDELTGLYNRSYLGDKFNTLTQEVDSSAEGERVLTLFFIDLNKFKEINDQFGHRYGDKVLGKVAQRIKGYLSAEDIAFRIGGDEFLIIKKGELPENYKQNLKLRIATPFLCGSSAMSVSASVGEACYPNDGQSLDELIHLADEKMYKEK
ncbi:sensor domain-containing diguanylate cyclase [Marinomonas pollencensis]|uniref:diguanylate cyclase n=1 Tax=Marinomonas pollencensis TaxID=491954 RepID=A0A3E0DKT4_9GAMM|nr:GGDEF domain-containing protein [Marinomonas pollencensis]REG83253.1 diguanylate cyclase (GGDEF)-like protein [Marinomonas pollencensis]